MAGLGDAEYKCSLTDDVWKKAKKELKEDEKTRLVEVKTLRQRVEKVPGLKAKLDFRFLLSFLRARKFDQERAFQLIKHHYEVKRDNSDIFTDLKPSRIKHVIEDGIVEVLQHRDNDGCRVVVFRPGKWNPDRYPMLEFSKCLFLILSKLTQTDEETQVHGVHLINNLADVTMKHATNLNPSHAKKIMSIMQDVIPLRLKRIDYVNEPGFFDVVFAIVKPFMKKKLLKRLHFNGSKPEKLHSTMNPDFLPTDLGGKLPLYQNKAFMDDLLASDAEFEELNKHGFVNMAVGKHDDVSQSGDAGVQGLGGTFKKLDI